MIESIIENMNPPRQGKMDIETILFADKNPKLHNLQTLAESEQRFGFIELPVINATTGKLVVGEGRIRSLLAIKQAGHPPPVGITVRKSKWFIDVRMFYFTNDAEAQAYLYESNLSVLAGSDALALDYAKLFDLEVFQEDMAILAAEKVLPPSFDSDALQFLSEIVDSQKKEQSANVSYTVCPKCGFSFKSEAS